MGVDRAPSKPVEVNEDDFIVMFELSLLCEEITAFGFDFVAGATKVEDHVRFAERLRGVADAVACVTLDAVGQCRAPSERVATSADLTAD